MSRVLHKLASTLALIGLMGAVFCPPCCPDDGRDEANCFPPICDDVTQKSVIEAELGCEAD